MSLKLCNTCRKIPLSFWNPDPDDQGVFKRKGVKLRPFRFMQASADTGCPLCKILIASAQVDFLSDIILEREPMILSKAILDSHQAVCLIIGGSIDDVSHTTFFRVPEPWVNDDPISLNKPVNNMRIIQIWIKECELKHEKCSNNLINFFPSRVLDLQAFEAKEDIRLASLLSMDLDYDGSLPGYLALSHCWGPPEKHPITTTKDNLNDRMARISISTLSNTFLDAVRTTRALGERFLWIDSLCIIQDDEDDWAREAALMAKVYGGAKCTLAALSSKDSTEGCRSPTCIQETLCKFVDVDFRDWWGRSCRIRFFEEEPEAWHAQYGDNTYRYDKFGDEPLRSRAWTLQERELSTRIIHFGRNQLLWECRESKASAQLPWHRKTLEDAFEQLPLRNSTDEKLGPGGPAALRDRWYELVEGYSSRSLTKSTDKLPAFSRLAQYFQTLLPGSTYVAGMWSTQLPAALLWRTRYDKAYRSSTYIAPTWSWASIVGEISYESQRVEETRDTTARASSADCDFGSLTIEEANTKPRHNDNYGAITDGYLFLSGARLATLDSNIQTLEPSTLTLDIKNAAVLTSNRVPVGLLYCDEYETSAPFNGLVCLEVRREPHDSPVQRPGKLFEGEAVENELVMGLVLEKQPTRGERYKRVGLARWVKKSLFKETKTTYIILI